MSVKNHEILPAPKCCLHQFCSPHKALTCFISKWFIAALKTLSLLCFGWSFSLSGLAQHAFWGLTDISLHLGAGDVWEHLVASFLKSWKKRIIGSDIKQINEALERYFSGWPSEHVLCGAGGAISTGITSGSACDEGWWWQSVLPAALSARKASAAPALPLCNTRLMVCSCSHPLKVARSL